MVRANVGDITLIQIIGNVYLAQMIAQMMIILNVFIGDIMVRIVFYHNHMVSTNGKQVKITRFMVDQPDKVFSFKMDLDFDEAISWGKRWIDRVVY